MAFPVRKRRQIGHLAFLLLWLRTRRSGVRVPRRGTLLSSFQSPRTRSVLKVGRLLGCIGCNNAALSRELKANAHLFSSAGSNLSWRARRPQSKPYCNSPATAACFRDLPSSRTRCDPNTRVEWCRLAFPQTDGTVERRGWT